MSTLAPVLAPVARAIRVTWVHHDRTIRVLRTGLRSLSVGKVPLVVALARFNPLA